MCVERGNVLASEAVMVSVAWTYFDLDSGDGQCVLAIGTVVCGEIVGGIESSLSSMILGRGICSLGVRCSRLLMECVFLVERRFCLWVFN